MNSRVSRCGVQQWRSTVSVSAYEVNVHLSVKFDVATLQRSLSPEQLSALMRGIAECLTVGEDARG